MLVLLLATACLLEATLAAEIKIIDCGSEAGKINAIDISPCKGAPGHCELPASKVANISVTFTPSEKVTAVTAAVQATIKGQSIPYPLPQPDGCQDSGLRCPLANAKKVTYSMGLDIPPVAPGTRARVAFKLTDQHGHKIACFAFNVKIV